jgi:hypothetical protein
MSPRNREVKRGKDCYVRYPKLTYATLQDGLTRILIEREVGRNGWAVIAILSKAVYYDGRFRPIGAEEMSRQFGLTKAQISRGMAELRDKGIIMPVTITTARGYRKPDRSNFGHVAQYRFTSEVWREIEREPEES